MNASTRPCALITGASRGIGKGIALALAQLGHHLILNYRTQADAASQVANEAIQLAATHGHTIQAIPIQTDIAQPSQHIPLLDQAWQHLGRIDLLVNNAGIAPQTRADLLETTTESFDAVLATNLRGPFFLTQQVARRMISQEPIPGSAWRGRIVTISSISAYTASINRGEYCLSKAALSMLTPLFATRLAPHQIQVFEIRPGIISTDMTDAVQSRYDTLIKGGLTPLPRWGTPGDIGRAVAAIAQDSFPFSTGEILNIDGGFHLRRL